MSPSTGCRSDHTLDKMQTNDTSSVGSQAPKSKRIFSDCCNLFSQRTASHASSTKHLQGHDVVNQLVSVDAGRPGLGHALGRSALELPCPLTQSSATLAAHQRRNGRRHLAPLELAVERHADPPHVLDVPGVPHLVAEARAAQHRHSRAHALHRRVPPAVRPEPAHRRVRQDLLLWRPPHDRAPAACRGVEAVGEGGRLGRRRAAAADEARPEHPEEGVVAVGDAPGRLHEVGGGHAGEAAEADVEHGRRGLRVQPFQAAAVLLQKAARRCRRELVERADVEHWDAEVAPERRQLVGLERVEGVEDEPRGGRRRRQRPGNRLPHYGVPGAAGGQEVPDAVRRQLRHRRVQLRLLRRLVALVAEHGERHKAAEAGGAAGAQHQRRYAKPPRGVHQRQQVRVGDEARHVALPGQQGGEPVPERRRARAVQGEDVLDGGLHRVRGALREDPAGGDGDEVVVGVEGCVGPVEVGVEDGDGEATRVEEAGELEHGVDVSLVREREEQHAAAAVAGGRVCYGAHGYWTLMVLVE
uniref:Uncharacterized protein n=1 Tax=Arundo donax TaxID=35708 RepID=A0A0A9FGJ5_ARUDO